MDDFPIAAAPLQEFRGFARGEQWQSGGDARLDRDVAAPVKSVSPCAPPELAEPISSCAGLIVHGGEVNKTDVASDQFGKRRFRTST